MQFGVLAQHNWYFVCKGVLSPITNLQGYYVSIPHKIFGNFATKLLSCTTVWNGLWTLVFKRYMKQQWQWFILELRSFTRINPAGDATVPHLHSTDWKSALFLVSGLRLWRAKRAPLFLYFSLRTCNSTMQIRTPSPIQCFCDIKL